MSIRFAWCLMSVLCIASGDALAMRPRQVLECYERDALRYVDHRGRHAVLLTPDGRRVAVRRGMYLGTDDGRVMRITRDAIFITEVVSDGEGGWLERAVTIVREAAGVIRPVSPELARNECLRDEGLPGF